MTTEDKKENKALTQTSISERFSKSEKKVIELLKKIDEIAKEKDFNATVFAQSGYSLFLLKNPTKEQIETELMNELILNDRVMWKSKNLIGDGGDADFG